jgi:5-(carboxyamino)imidazole ribonucleotide synthase
MRTILPGATLGILGGGQLGRMFALEAKRMGYRVITLEPTPDSPCGQVADEQILADYTDEAALKRLADASDVVTYEFENIDARAVEFLEGLGKAVHPDSRVLRISQDRLLEKDFLRGAGLGVTAYLALNSIADLAEAEAKVGLPAVIKTVRGGYDGKGQAVVADRAGAAAAFTKLFSGQPLIWERKVSFTKELSVVACRGIDGKAKAFPVSENIHVENILDTGIVPARISAAAAAKARSMAETVGDALGIVGAYCVELFLLDGDGLLVNEIAPRPHNSGHYTLDACVCSQFEQQVRAICGLPLGSTEALKPSVMINILGDGRGDTLFGSDDAMREDGLVLHLYGKSQAAAKRKMGHFTVLGDSVVESLAKARAARALLRWG